MTLMQDVEDRLRRMILDMEIGPGERLTERWIEAQLGASRTSVRTALFRLEADGFVSREGRGWIVPPIDLEEIEQLFVYREVLETAALRLSAGGIDPDRIAEIETVLHPAVPDVTPEQSSEAGRRFHIWIAGLSHNPFISRAIADAMARLERVRWLESDPQHHGWDEHRAILAALKNGETERAVTLMAAHTRDTRDRLLDALRRNRRSLRARGAIIRQG